MSDLFAARLAQRERALADGFSLLGWTFDPLDLSAAALSIARLGAVVDGYDPDEELLVAHWWIRRPHVARRIAAAGKLVLRAHDAGEAPVVAAGEVTVQPERRRAWVEFSADDNEGRRLLRVTLTAHFVHRYRIVDFAAGQRGRLGRYLLARST